MRSFSVRFAVRSSKRWVPLGELSLQLLSALAALPGLPPTAGPIFQYAGYGIVLVVFLLLLPRGIVPSVVSGYVRLRSRSARQRVPAREAARR